MACRGREAAWARELAGSQRDVGKPVDVAEVVLTGLHCPLPCLRPLALRFYAVFSSTDIAFAVRDHVPDWPSTLTM